MKINYVKVNVNDQSVIDLAKQIGEKVETVASLINQQNYRKEYNKIHNAKMKLVKQLMKEVGVNGVGR